MLASKLSPLNSAAPQTPHGATLNLLDGWEDVVDNGQMDKQTDRLSAWMDAMDDTLLVVRGLACVKDSGSYTSGDLSPSQLLIC